MLLQLGDVRLALLPLLLIVLDPLLEPLAAMQTHGGAGRGRISGSGEKGASCKSGAHMSLLINSMRLETLFFTSSSSCFTSTGPISLKTPASSSKISSS